MWEGYLELAGVEVINSARATALAANAGLRMDCAPCDTVAAALGHDPYTAVDQPENAAPWYDPGRPESRQFLGVLGLGVKGFDISPVERNPNPLIGDGSALGTLRRTHREIAYSVLLLYQSECALSYALGWLSKVLRGSLCDTYAMCAGDEICVFSCCPGDTPSLWLEPGEAELRHLFGVGLLGPPSAGEMKDFGAVKGLEYSFVLGAGKPWIYHEPLPAPRDWEQLAQGRYLRVDPDLIYDACPEPRPCAQDPLCPPPPLPPTPSVPVSPCYPTGVDEFFQTIVQVPAELAPQQLELVPVIEVRTGVSEMRRLIVNFWQNPQDMPCEEISDPCQVCFSVVVPYLPAASTLTIDGRSRRAVVECPRGLIGTARNTPEIYGQQGGRFTWPVLECPTGVCVEVLSKRTHTALDASARVRLVPRQDAG